MAASPRNRVLKQALLASLALHAALLAGVPELRPAMTRAVESVPIIARLLDPQPAAVPVPAKERKPEPPARAKPVVPADVPTQPVPSPIPAPVAEPLAPAPREVAAAAAPPPDPAPPSVARTEGIRPVPAAPSAPAPENRSADQYRIALIASANRIKERLRYPPQAKENNWEGDVRLGVVIRASGQASITVKRSSRYEVLDRQAVEILTLAAQEVSLPQALQGRESSLRDLSFEYRLKD